MKKLLLISLLALTGCTSTRYVPMESVRVEYRDADTTALYARLQSFIEQQRDRERSSDSLVDRSRETIVINAQGDTTRRDRERIVYRATARERELELKALRQDSIISSLRQQLTSVTVDSVPVPYPVEKKLTKWQRTKLDYGGEAILTTGFCLAALLWLLFLYLRRKKS